MLKIKNNLIFFAFYLFILNAAHAEQVFSIGYLRDQNDHKFIIDYLQKENKSNQEIILKFYKKIFSTELMALGYSAESNTLLIPCEEAISFLARNHEWRVVGKTPYRKEKIGKLNFGIILMEMNLIMNRPDETKKIVTDIRASYAVEKISTVLNNNDIEKLDILQSEVQKIYRKPIKIRDYIMHDYCD